MHLRGVISLFEVYEEYHVNMEVYSEESMCGFSEHYSYNDGEILDERVDFRRSSTSMPENGFPLAVFENWCLMLKCLHKGMEIMASKQEFHLERIVNIMRIGDDLLNREIQIGDKFPTVFGIFKVVEIKGDTCLCSNEYTTNPISFSKNEIRKHVEFQ